MSSISFIRGRNGKPAASRALEEILSRIEGISGECFFGFPVVATPEGKYSADATLVSPEKGVVLFDLVEGSSVGDYTRRQDDLANKIEAKLKLHRELVRGRNLIPPLSVITFAPAVREVERFAEDGYPLANEDDLEQVLSNIIWADYNENFYRTTLSAIESLSSIRQSRLRREVRNPDSRGAKLKRLEESIATLDYRQNRAVIETVDGVQRIRGLAGSGKTIVLALKAAYLHTQYPDWRIAVTFYTRSLKEQFRRLINNFCIELSGEEPDWEKIRVVNSWGSIEDTQAGLYYEFCRYTGAMFYNYEEAAQRFGRSRAFDGACQEALNSVNLYPELYDAILVDEAQDFAPSFLRLCYAMLKPPKRLVYAYDELQNLSGVSLPPPEEIFGTDSTGRPLVSLSDDAVCDVILKACYRNSRPVLVTAHSLGFGIYRNQKGNVPTGLVQMFDYPALWHEIGYRVREGRLEKGERVVLERTDETSPRFLEDHSPVEDIVVFKAFKNEVEQNAWLIEQIKKNIEDEELRHDDIIVIDVSTASSEPLLKSIREDLKNSGIESHIAGVDTHRDVFFSQEPSVALTNIYRAKGNEAGMVYIINAQDCAESETGLATLRNRLFTAITRSKAWVRVLGYGQGMENLLSEFNKLRDNSFKLDFTYPDNELLEKLKVVHQDLSPHERQRLEQKYSVIRELRDAIENGEITSADLSDEDRQVLMNFLQSENH
jgi:superfamily I DNA and RNA helicase